MNRIVLAFRAFFNLLFSGELSAEILIALDLSRRSRAAPKAAAPAPAAPAAPTVRASDGALQILAILQRDSRLVDFLMEDIAGYADDQIGAAVRELHDQCRDALARYVTLQPVIDGVEGTLRQGAVAAIPNLVKFVGNVPAKPPAGGTLRHKGWRAAKVDLPALPAKQDAVDHRARRKSKSSKKTQPAKYVIGIDLGTTNSRAGLRGDPAGRRPVRAGQRAAAGRFRNW